MDKQVGENEAVLELAPSLVEVGKLLRAFESFAGLVRNVAGREGAEWLASVETGSNVLRMKFPGNTEMPPGLIRLTDGLSAFARPELHAPPEGFGPSQTELLLKLCKVVGKLPGGGQIKVGRTTTPLTGDYTANVERVHKLGYVEIGSLEGTLDAINVHTDNRLTLYRYGHHSKVSITFPDSMFEAVRKAVKKRVIVRGPIAYDLAHRIKSMELTELRVVPEDGQLPSLAEVVGILRNEQ